MKTRGLNTKNKNDLQEFANVLDEYYNQIVDVILNWEDSGTLDDKYSWEFYVTMPNSWTSEGYVRKKAVKDLGDEDGYVECGENEEGITEYANWHFTIFKDEI